MAKLVWDKIGDRRYETGVDHGVLYAYIPAEGNNPASFGNGVAWNGLTAVNESPSGAEPSPLYADNIKYLNLISAEDYGFSIECYTYPDEFAACDGSKEIATGVTVGQQDRELFGFSYRSLIGNDTLGTSYGYKLHLVYNCLASVAERAHATVNDSPEADNPSWDVSTTPVEVPNMKPTACITIDSTKVDSAKLTALENILYGTDAGTGTEATVARLPWPSEVITRMSNT